MRAVGMGPYRKIKIEEADGSSSWQKKNTTSLSLFMEAYGLEVEEEFPPWPLSTGQKEGSRMENGIMNKTKLG